MLVETLTEKIWLIGDPHHGRDFRNGTPLHRRGDRERMQREQFLTELNTPDVNTIVMVGDLFDKPFVPLPILSQVIGDVVNVALARPEVDFIEMAGNHDRSRQLDVQGAWDIFKLAVGWLPNVYIVEEPAAIRGVMYYPWQWDMTAVEQVERFGSRSCGYAVGHWDLKDFGGDTSHMVPIKELRALNPDVQIYSGHYHLEGEYDGVFCTGSMQPYAHGEGEEMYLTLTVEEALARDDLYDKCIRILLPPGEVMPELDCLQLTSKREGAELEEVELEAIGAATFNVGQCLEDEMEKAEVPGEVRVFIKEKLGVVA